ncbi:hypothetical protein KOI40_03050 [Aestuariicella sp. G3-2]|uniref:zonular occludens toxin family protein n=1 Tax=Pseudomaricurvus albidus TaxID=2842452 RepID=UPI001C0B18E1|nr:zonular occludens toxin domain-containing protein [Aestuariicella albida]MBU3068779.1 hypothetical protein [Aestuariicella albida]
MTAVIHHGPPGSYKSFTITQRKVIEALQQGRTVISNVRGLNSIENIEKALNIEFPPEAELISVPHTLDGCRTMARFFHWAPRGALIFIDEAQKVYPTRLRNLTEFDLPDELREQLPEDWPITVEMAFDQHRHYNWDIYLSTTNIAKVHKEIRGVVQYAYRHRDMSGVLPWWKDKWKEEQHDPSDSGTSASHCIGKPKFYKADKRIFECYQSTATGDAQGSNESKEMSILREKKVWFLLGLIVVALGVFVNSGLEAVGNFEDKMQKPDPIPVEKASESRSVVSNGAPIQLPAQDDAPLDHRDQFIEQHKLSYLGMFATKKGVIHYFKAVRDDGTWYQFTNSDLLQLDFKIRYRTSFVELFYLDKRVVIAPANSGYRVVKNPAPNQTPVPPSGNNGGITILLGDNTEYPNRGSRSAPRAYRTGAAQKGI